MTRRKDLPERFRGQSFRVADVRVAGASRRRMRALDMDRPFHGIRSPVGADPLRALLPAFRAGDAYAGPTAARLWDLPLPVRLTRDPRLWVSSRIPTTPMRRRGVVGIARVDGDVIEVDGIPVLTPLATWATLAGRLDDEDLVAIADRLISGGFRAPRLVEPSDLRDFAAEKRPHARALRRAAESARQPVWSRPESLLRLALLAAGLPEPVTNPELRLTSGRTAFPDLAWPDLKLGVEYDGHWHEEGDRPSLDAARREDLADDGWTTLTIRSADLFPVPSVAVARVLQRRARLGAPASALVDFARMPRFEP